MRKSGSCSRISLGLVLVGVVLVAVSAAAQFELGSTEVSRSKLVLTPTAPASTKEWTVLFYAACDWVGYDPGNDFAREFRSLDNVHVLMLEDTFDQPVYIWSIGGSANRPHLQAVDRIGERDTGSEEVLSYAIEFCREWYPSNRLMIMMYDHGYAWQGACTDQHPVGWDLEDLSRPRVPPTMLSPQEMHDACAANGGIDALLFTAPCVMANLEVAYELRDVVHAYVASEESSGYIMWHSAMDAIARLLDSSTTMDTLDVCIEIARSVETACFADDFGEGMPWLRLSRLLSVIDTAGLDDLASALDEFARAALENMESIYDSLAAAKGEALSFWGPQLVDIYDLALRCVDIPALSKASASVMGSLMNAVVYSFAEPGTHDQARGLQIWFSDRQMAQPGTQPGDHTAEYRSHDLDLVERTQWDEMLTAYFSHQAEREKAVAN